MPDSSRPPADGHAFAGEARERAFEAATQSDGHQRGCPACGSPIERLTTAYVEHDPIGWWRCYDCGHQWHGPWDVDGNDGQTVDVGPVVVGREEHDEGPR